MNPPKSMKFDGQVYWDRGTAYIIEYALWSHGGPITYSDLCRKVITEYLPTIAGPTISVKLHELTNQKVVKKLRRGLYIHPQVAVMFE